MGKNGGGFLSCLCRPRHPDDMGVLSSKTTVAATPSPSMQSKRRELPGFTDDFATSPFIPEDTNWFRNDDTEPTVEEEEEEDKLPFEKAYRFWYSKGLLSFVPQSIQEEEKIRMAEKGWAAFPVVENTATVEPQTRKQKKSAPKSRLLPPPATASPSGNATKSPNVPHKLDFPSNATSETKGTRFGTPQKRASPGGTSPSSSARKQQVSTPDIRSIIGNERRDLKLRSDNETTNHLLPPPRSKQEDCASCGSRIVTRVRCVQCKQTVYCSMFCRGNDRYKHGSVCSKRYCETVSPASSSPKIEESPNKVQPSWKKRVSVDEDPQPEAHTLRRYWEDRTNLEYNDQ